MDIQLPVGDLPFNIFWCLKHRINLKWDSLFFYSYKWLILPFVFTRFMMTSISTQLFNPSHRMCSYFSPPASLHQPEYPVYQLVLQGPLQGPFIITTTAAAAISSHLDSDLHALLLFLYILLLLECILHSHQSDHKLAYMTPTCKILWFPIFVPKLLTVPWALHGLAPSAYTLALSCVLPTVASMVVTWKWWVLSYLGKNSAFNVVPLLRMPFTGLSPPFSSSGSLLK